MLRTPRLSAASCTRRDFVRFTAAGVAASLSSGPLVTHASAQSPTGAPADLRFRAEGGEYRFATGVVQGTLRSAGTSRGLTPVVDSATGTPITKSLGLVSHYRLLDAEHRYGHAGWDWASTARLGDDGSVEATWTADAEHPFSLRADYRWRAADTLDVTTSVVPQRDLRRFEVFLASYFQGFAAAHVRVAGCPQTGDKAGFLEAKLENGVWQMFPRDDEAVKTILDGRWQRPPNPVTWAIMPRLDVPLAMRHDVATGLTALVMAPREDCFAVSTPFGAESHRSLYFSLLGRDIKQGDTATARARLVIGRDISEQRAVALYEQYMTDIARGGNQ